MKPLNEFIQNELVNEVKLNPENKKAATEFLNKLADLMDEYNLDLMSFDDIKLRFSGVINGGVATRDLGNVVSPQTIRGNISKLIK